MIYEISLHAYVDNAVKLKRLRDELETLKPSIVLLNPGTHEEEESYLEVVECHHDQHPPQPCVSLFHWDNHSK